MPSRSPSRPLPTPSPTPGPGSRTHGPRRPGRGTAITVAALATLLAATPWLPDRVTPPSAEAPGLALAATAGPGRVTPTMQAEIDRVVTEGKQHGRTSAAAGPATLVDQGLRCADLDGQRYCLGIGFTTRTEEELTAELSASARSAAPATESTGDLATVDALRQRARMSPTARAALERRELTEAATSVAKVWVMRHQVEGAPLPEGFAERHPEAFVPADSENAASLAATSYPRSDTVLSNKQVRSQTRSYWCGPATMQMIAWGWEGRKRTQKRWARRLGTTTSGTAITEMVRVVNRYTGWDRDDRAGKYITLDVGDYRFRKWYRLIKRHIHDYRAPVVMHPILLKRYFPYLDDDASGHFQAGRGYRVKPNGAKKIGYFEPWDQSRFDPSEPYIARVQWRSAYKSFRANKAHFQHNIGV